ncbi:RidA/YER057c/UK114 superfamily protein [hydrothermal vent metagenome]|uniref:RidA/YER057c/UK114 superfamily protein n=1 Tax=hydrothermal vent metagenome TaxID=652676 RepID=A0A3B0V6F9_9ZZZZ
MRITSSKAPDAVGLYPHARKVGDLLFLSGVEPRKKGSKEIFVVTLNDVGDILSYDIETQCHSVFNKVYAAYFKDNQPCRTTVKIVYPLPL